MAKGGTRFSYWLGGWGGWRAKHFFAAVMGRKPFFTIGHYFYISTNHIINTSSLTPLPLLSSRNLPIFLHFCVFLGTFLPVVLLCFCKPCWQVVSGQWWWSVCGSLWWSIVLCGKKLLWQVIPLRLGHNWLHLGCWTSHLLGWASIQFYSTVLLLLCCSCTRTAFDTQLHHGHSPECKCVRRMHLGQQFRALS